MKYNFFRRAIGLLLFGAPCLPGLTQGPVVEATARATREKTTDMRSVEPSGPGHLLNVQVDQVKATIPSTLWGIFFEDINLGADGGLYAELVKNRSFEFYRPLMGWTVQRKSAEQGNVLVLNRKEENKNNPRYIRATVHQAGPREFGLTNEGFRGMGIKKDLRYDFSVLYHEQKAGLKLHVELADSNGRVLGGTVLEPAATGDDWQKASASFIATGAEPKAVMNLWLEGDGVIDLDIISLFPGDTWKDRPGGLRRDMVQMLADMKPGFIRFPGGCIVEGFDLSNRYQWKKTIGPVDERPLIVNRWNTEFPYRSTPDYYQTFGLGFFEYFQLAEDIGAEPLPILSCGLACQFNSAEAATLDELDPYVQDALDLIEFANADSTTGWGKVRAGMGHPLPFHLKMMGVGNENWGPQYIERLKIFTKAIHDKYPDFKLVNSAGPDPDGERFDYLNGELRKMNADLIDEHYYRSPEWFFSNARRYDNYPRNGTKIFAGEYAAHVPKTVSAEKRNCWLSALAEAAFMTGLERNSDVVNMASYAPLFANIDGWQWSPDLIWVNNLQSYGTPDYYVQKLYSLNKGTKTVPITLNREAVAGQDSLYASACIDVKTGELIVKVVNASGKPQMNTLALDGVNKLASQGSLTEMQSDDLSAVNSFDQPRRIIPQESVFPVKGKKIDILSAPYSFIILKVKTR